ncbi:hypothetical protein BDW59DRAFT_97412 [Aspergillus cavernicola]|uniref:F-box domain-containing protein n=1 Tax=Aspergillus cavernicola TaxID=176166 RepID=A0ABR4I6X7_9EURO
MTTPNIPWEIILLILKHAVDILPVPDLFRARLVNTTFADEIFTNILITNRLEEYRFHVKKWNYMHHWRSFPKRLKRQYLRSKIDRFHERPCALSPLVHEYLDSDTVVRRNQDRETG